MGDNLKAELDVLELVSRTWLTEVAPGLRQAAASIDPLKYTEVQFGTMFNGAWSAYSKAAAYVQDRLNEGAPAAEQLGNALHQAVVSFGAQQDEQAAATNNIAGEIGLPN
ncbi:hypothetical protein ACFXK0_26250 [Nocardia sp. NPDC059177]|uniref:hypothetical protein n=1 Tax=Nocardia sp. NPDC059177 TaxID=3346759 RepID=UPI00367FC8D9